MRFYKHTFPIRMNELSKKPILIVKGWAIEDYTIGFHRFGKEWIATDLYSGLQICKCPTRIACAEWVAAHRKLVEKRMEEPFYIWRVQEFRTLIEKELREES